MSVRESAAPFVPDDRTLPVLREAVQHCRGCDLYRDATQAVFGELESGTQANKPKVAIMMIGEQPGDQEDKEGRPFVGPAGRLLDQCLEEADIDRSKVYVTNTVKHFKWEPRGKLRIHKKPGIKGDSGLQTMAERRTGNRSPEVDYLPWSCCGSIPAWPWIQNHAIPWGDPATRRIPTHHGHPASLCHFARSNRRRPAAQHENSCRRFATSSCPPESVIGEHKTKKPLNAHRIPSALRLYIGNPAT